ncbi:hypothetical protein LT335_00449 [Spiroplasma sp. JKS002669]|uniref:Panacea domain-containing protein n=2 Tax=Spiroplasma attinicola TaxID=2904537 RepID=UPI0020BE505A|nr:type II toxin-antitoxin system antitoxin SocA domain-containing protein [Spiroplasma sp. JKS002669]MCL6428901.1 hypothetical protein [Spiroplasma sp. JKS002669]
MENFNIDLKKISEYVVNIIYDVNNFDINNTEEQKVSPLKLQNILYFLYAYALSTWNKTLWSNNFEKWVIGPVIPELYYDYSKNGVTLYNREKHFVKFPEIPNWERTNLEALVMDLNEKYNDVELARLAYDDVWRNTKANAIIKAEDIVNYYSENNTFFDDLYDSSLEAKVKFFS